MAKGTVVYETEEKEGGGAYILKTGEDSYEVWEIPLYGGEPVFYDKFDSLEEAMGSLKDLT